MNPAQALNQFFPQMLEPRPPKIIDMSYLDRVIRSSIAILVGIFAMLSNIPFTTTSAIWGVAHVIGSILVHVLGFAKEFNFVHEIGLILSHFIALFVVYVITYNVLEEIN